MNSNPRGAVLVCTEPALASKTPVYGSGATVAYARHCSSIAFQVAFARKLPTRKPRSGQANPNNCLALVVLSRAVLLLGFALS